MGIHRSVVLIGDAKQPKNEEESDRVETRLTKLAATAQFV